MKFLNCKRKQEIEDLGKSTAEEVGLYYVETLLPEIIKDASDSAVVQLLGTAIGTAVPVVSNIYTSWQISIMKRNIKAIENCMKHHETMIKALESECSEEESEHLLDLTGILLENSLTEYQEEKVKKMAKGFISFACMDEINIDAALVFFKTMHELTNEDIAILEHFNHPYDEIDLSDYAGDRLIIVVEKLTRLGLLHNIKEDRIVKELENLSKTINTAQLNHGNLNVIPWSPSSVLIQDDYIISSFGKDLLDLISDDSKEEDGQKVQ